MKKGYGEQPRSRTREDALDRRSYPGYLSRASRVDGENGTGWMYASDPATVLAKEEEKGESDRWLNEKVGKHCQPPQSFSLCSFFPSEHNVYSEQQR